MSSKILNLNEKNGNIKNYNYFYMLNSKIIKFTKKLLYYKFLFSLYYFIF